MAKQKSTLYGLIRQSDASVIYDVSTGTIIEYHGCTEAEVAISEEKAFNMPIYISINGVPVFPTKYDPGANGPIVYSSHLVPNYSIKFLNNHFLNSRAKVRMYTIKHDELIMHDVLGRSRYPGQNQVMKMSANQHVQKLIQDGMLKFTDANVKVNWHWCHLIAFSMLPTHKAQKANNLVCGTSACNGQMANIESAVKRFVYDHKRPLGLEVTAQYYAGTFLADNIRYRIFDKKGSLLSHSEYFNALTHVKADMKDHQTIYQSMCELFSERLF